MTIEEKAKAYDEAIKKVNDYYEGKTKIYSDVDKTLEYIFPKLKESEDVSIMKEITELEKQDNVDKVSYEIAEKEKHDFVSGQFLYCKGSFCEFKEGESYWLEYVGNDNYIGRSDNALNQKFHITPRQLYHWFTPQHCPKDFAEEAASVLTSYNKYIDECFIEAMKHYSSEGEDKYSDADLFYAGVRCGQSYVKKQCKSIVIIPKFRVGDNIKTTNEEYLTITKIDDKGYWSNDLFICNFDDADKWELVEQKPTLSKEDEVMLNNIGEYDWSWWWVVSPIWIPIALIIAVYLICAIISCFLKF